jgi:hypothetical protein
MEALGFCPIWISWLCTLHSNVWYSVGINGLNSEPFQLSRYIRQGYLLASFFYLFVVDCLGYVLEQDDSIESIILPSNHEIKDQEYANDTNLYLWGILKNNVKIFL